MHWMRNLKKEIEIGAYTQALILEAAFSCGRLLTCHCATSFPPGPPSSTIDLRLVV